MAPSGFNLREFFVWLVVATPTPLKNMIPSKWMGQSIIFSNQ